jgi:adenosylcobinamide-phosphate synthase
VLVVVGLTLAVGLLYSLLVSVSWVLGLLLNVAVLYFALGFRQFSHRGSEIQIALANGDLAAARRELTAWKRLSDPTYSAADLTSEEVVRQAIEHGLLLAQRHVFGVSSGSSCCRSDGCRVLSPGGALGTSLEPAARAAASAGSFW